jgi:membrane-associated protease RseP (regulator of RpoE activity)
MTTNEKMAGWFELLMASGYGRLIRLGIGITVITLAVLVLDGLARYVVAAFGLVPIAAGVFNLCPVAPLWGGHFLGSLYCSGANSVQD